MNSNVNQSVLAGSFQFNTPFTILDVSDTNGNQHFSVTGSAFQLNYSNNGTPEVNVTNGAITFQIATAFNISATSGGGAFAFSNAGVFQAGNGSSIMQMIPATKSIDVGNNSFNMLNVTGPSNVGINANGATGRLLINSVQVMGVQQTGWTAMTGTATKGGFDTATVTLPQLAQVVKAMLDGSLTHGFFHT